MNLRLISALGIVLLAVLLWRSVFVVEQDELAWSRASDTSSPATSALERTSSPRSMMFTSSITGWSHAPIHR
jgi:hypothetical protein